MDETCTVMVADDSAFVRRMLTTHLSGTEFQVVAEAVNGADAVEKYRIHTPDMLLLDIVMPVRNGPDALQEIMRSDQTAKVLMLSSMGTQEAVTQCLSLGARSFIQKPFTRDVLVNQLRAVAAQ
jgi:two-component system chemotaxis response regulator CheY